MPPNHNQPVRPNSKPKLKLNRQHLKQKPLHNSQLNQYNHQNQPHNHQNRHPPLKFWQPTPKDKKQDNLYQD